MNAKMKLNLALLAVAAALGAVVALNPGQKKEESVPLAHIDAQAVKKIQIAGRQNLTLEKREGHWFLTGLPRPAPLPLGKGEKTAAAATIDVPANENRVEQLLQIPQAGSDAQYPVDAGQLAKFQLNPPNATLKLDDLTLEFGGSEPIQSRRYVKVGNTLHLATDTFYHHLTAAPSDYVEKKLLPDNAQIQRIQLPGLALSKDKDGKWSAEPAQSDAGPLYEMADAWKNARAYDVQIDTPPKDGKAPVETALITLADGRTVEFAIRQRSPDAILVRSDWGLQFHLAEGISKSLLNLQKPEKPGEAPPAEAKP